MKGEKVAMAAAGMTPTGRKNLPVSPGPSVASSVFRSDPEDGLTSEEELEEPENSSFLEDSLHPAENSLSAGVASRQGQGRRRETSPSSVGGYSPPAWRRLHNGERSGGFWRPGDNILGNLPTTGINNRRPPNTFAREGSFGGAGNLGRRVFGTQLHTTFSREPGLDVFDGHRLGDGDELVGGGYYDENENILARAIRTRLPGSMSPEKGRSPEPEVLPANIHGQIVKAGQRLNSIDRIIKDEHSDDGESSPFLQRERENTEPPTRKLANDNCECGPFDNTAKYFLLPIDSYHPLLSLDIRFAIQAEVQHRTEPIESSIQFTRRQFHRVMRSWTSIFVSMLVVLLSVCATRLLTSPAAQRPVPDLVKVAGIARSFEPLIYFSENGINQVNELQNTGVAVWDLGESVRGSNMTSAPIIVKELDELSDSLKTLALELTRFFANVDGDVDAYGFSSLYSPSILSAWAEMKLLTHKRQNSQHSDRDGMGAARAIDTAGAVVIKSE